MIVWQRFSGLIPSVITSDELHRYVCGKLTYDFKYASFFNRIKILVEDDLRKLK